MTIGDEKVVERFSLEGYGGWLGLDADGDFVSHDAYAELAAELAEIRSERDSFAKHNDLLTHKIITCGVAARNPDPKLSKVGAYVGKWDSPQAQDVRALRDRCDAAESQLAELRGKLEGLAGSIESWHWDIGDVKKAKQFATDLRKLAAADGGG